MTLMKHRYIFLLALVAFSCQKEKEPVDTIVFNAKIYTVNDNFDTAEAFAVKDGKFVEVGTSQAIQEKYQALKNVDAQGQAIFPGLIDAHAHFLSLGQFLQQVNLVGTTSFDDMMKRILDFQNENNLPERPGADGADRPALHRRALVRRRRAKPLSRAGRREGLADQRLRIHF